MFAHTRWASGPLAHNVKSYPVATATTEGDTWQLESVAVDQVRCMQGSDVSSTYVGLRVLGSYCEFGLSMASCGDGLCGKRVFCAFDALCVLQSCGSLGV